MLFFNVDHIESELIPKSRAASSQFFMGSASLCEVFAHLESASPVYAGQSALQSADRFEAAANAFRELADTIQKSYQWIRAAVKEISFSDAAREVQLAWDSVIIQEMIADLLRDEIDGVLRTCAGALIDFAGRLRKVGERVAGANVLLDLEYTEAHKLIGDWRNLIIRGQFISSVCLLSARVSA